MKYTILTENSFGDWIFHHKTFTTSVEAVSFAKKYIRNYSYKVIAVIYEETKK